MSYQNCFVNISLTLDGDVEAHVLMIIKSFPVPKHKKKIFKEETVKNEELQAVLKYNKNGWPE